MSLKLLHPQNAFFLSDPVLEPAWYIHRLLLCNQFPLSSAAYHSSFWGLRILAWLSWGFWLRAPLEAVVKLSARTTVSEDLTEVERSAFKLTLVAVGKRTQFVSAVGRRPLFFAIWTIHRIALFFSDVTAGFSQCAWFKREKGKASKKL